MSLFLFFVEAFLEVRDDLHDEEGVMTTSMFSSVFPFAESSAPSLPLLHISDALIKRATPS